MRPKSPDIIEKLSRSLPVIKERLFSIKGFQARIPEDIDEARGMISRCEKMIDVLKSSGQWRILPAIRWRLKRLRMILKHLIREDEEEQKLLNAHHDKMQREGDAQDRKEMIAQLKLIKKYLETFSSKYDASFQKLKANLVASVAQKKERLGSVLDQLREVNEEMLGVKDAISEVDTEITSKEAGINYAEIALANELNEEWSEHDLSIAKPDFRKLIQDCIDDKNELPKNLEDLAARVMFKLHEIIQQSKKQELGAIKEEIDLIDAKQEMIDVAQEQLEVLEKNIRERMRTSPNAGVLLGVSELKVLRERKRKLLIQEQQLEKREEELHAEALELSEEIKEAEKKIQDIVEVSEPLISAPALEPSQKKNQDQDNAPRLTLKPR